MTRILHVTECFSGGVSRALRTIVELVPEHEHHLLYAGLDDPSDMGFASVRELPGSPISRVRAVRAAASDLDVDVVHAHSSWAGMYARVLPLRTRVVYQPHGYRVNDPGLARPLGWVYGAAERALGAFTDATVVLSPQEHRLARRFSPRADVIMMPNAPTLKVRFAAGGEDHPPKVIMIGRISPQKDPEFFSEVARLVHAVRPDIRFVWVGDSEADVDGAGSRDLEAAGVEVTGWVDAKTVEDHLENASLYLHTASYEGFPLSVLDGAAVGTPVAVREIEAFEDTVLRTVKTPSDAALLTLAAIGDASITDDLRERSQALLDVMNHDNQRRALLHLYSPEECAKSAGNRHAKTVAPAPEASQEQPPAPVVEPRRAS